MLNRRAMLAGALGVAGLWLVGRSAAGAPRPQAPPVMPSQASFDLEAFLTLSALLVGGPGLDPEAGQRHLATVLALPGGATALQMLAHRLGLDSHQPPTSLDQIADEILFADEPSMALADTIVGLWLEGGYERLQEQLG